MPSRVACPGCGADGTATANEIISRSMPDPRPPVSLAASNAGKGSFGAVSERRVPGLRVPVNDDAKRDLLEAKLDIRRATSAALIVAGLDLLLAVLNLCGVHLLGTDLWILLDVLIVAGLAYGIHHFSRACAVLMCVYFLALCILIYVGGKKGSIGGIVGRAVFLYYFLRGAQAMFTYHKLKKEGY